MILGNDLGIEGQLVGGRVGHGELGPVELFGSRRAGEAMFDMELVRVEEIGQLASAEGGSDPIPGQEDHHGRLRVAVDQGCSMRESGPDDTNHQRLKFNDHVAQGELYMPWASFNHPLYGEIEIGGWTKMSSRLPHPFMLQDLVHRNASSVIFSAAQTPEIQMELIEKKKIGKDLYQVRIRLLNDNAIPTLTYQSLKNKSHRKDILKVSGASIDVVAGGELMDAHMNKALYKEHKPQIQFIHMPGFGKVEYQFLISGKGTVKVDYSSLKAKDQELEFNL